MSFSWAKPYEPKHPLARWFDERLPLPRLVYGAIGGGYPVPRNLNYFWNFAEAEQESRKAVALDPNFAYAHEVYCWILASKRRTEEGLAECRKARELDPLSPINSRSMPMTLAPPSLAL